MGCACVETRARHLDGLQFVCDGCVVERRWWGRGDFEEKFIYWVVGAKYLCAFDDKSISTTHKGSTAIQAIATTVLQHPEASLHPCACGDSDSAKQRTFQPHTKKRQSTALNPLLLPHHLVDTNHLHNLFFPNLHLQCRPTVHSTLQTGDPKTSSQGHRAQASRPHTATNGTSETSGRSSDACGKSRRRATSQRSRPQKARVSM